ncbi:hypothetical protein BSKO_04117 [Bryopsis sp. KO-2023]|nr:hypothetical protein BSKO_04117 [Bryopsis sp. KO-2023]
MYLLQFDLQDAYHILHIQPQDAKVLQFSAIMPNESQPRAYQCIALPFGLSVSPYYYVTTMKPVTRFLRSPQDATNHTIPASFLGALHQENALHDFWRWNPTTAQIPYIDDFLVAQERFKDLQRWGSLARRILDLLGLKVQEAKSDWTPKQQREHLGIVIDTQLGEDSLFGSRAPQYASRGPQDPNTHGGALLWKMSVPVTGYSSHSSFSNPTAPTDRPQEIMVGSHAFGWGLGGGAEAVAHFTSSVAQQSLVPGFMSSDGGSRDRRVQYWLGSDPQAHTSSGAADSLFGYGTELGQDVYRPGILGLPGPTPPHQREGVQGFATRPQGFRSAQSISGDAPHRAQPIYPFTDHSGFHSCLPPPPPRSHIGPCAEARTTVGCLDGSLSRNPSPTSLDPVPRECPPGPPIPRSAGAPDADIAREVASIPLSTGTTPTGDDHNNRQICVLPQHAAPTLQQFGDRTLHGRSGRLSTDELAVGGQLDEPALECPPQADRISQPRQADPGIAGHTILAPLDLVPYAEQHGSQAMDDQGTSGPVCAPSSISIPVGSDRLGSRTTSEATELSDDTYSAEEALWLQTSVMDSSANPMDICRKFAKFRIFCADTRRQAFPASKAAIYMYLRHLRESGIKSSSGRTYLSAISTYHQIHGLHNFSAHDALTKRLFRAWENNTPVDAFSPQERDVPVPVFWAILDVGITSSELKIVRAAVETCLAYVFFSRSSSHHKMLVGDLRWDQTNISFQERHFKGKTAQTQRMRQRTFDARGVPSLITLLGLYRQHMISEWGGTWPDSASFWQLPQEAQPTAVGISKMFTFLKDSTPSIWPPGDWRHHDLRAGGASSMLALGIDEDKVKSWGGWSLRSTAFTRYINPSRIPTAGDFRLFGWLLMGGQDFMARLGHLFSSVPDPGV